MEQRTIAWFDARLGKATASGFGAVMSSPTTAGYQNYLTQLVLERITGTKADGYTSPAMQFGIDTEPIARNAYTAETGNEIETIGFIEHPELDAGASPDGKLVNLNIGLEIKCPNTATHVKTLQNGRLPAQYRAQVQGQMWIAGYDAVDFVSFDPRLPLNAQLFILRVGRDNKYIKELEDRVRQFLANVEEQYQFIMEYTR